MIGIFWVYREMVFGQSEPVSAGTEAVVGLVDSNLAHVELWDRMTAARHTFPELAAMEYQDVSRGRVLWQRRDARHRVYLDKTLFNPSTRSAIAKFFGFDATQAVWITDSHYTTSPEDLEALFLD